MVLNAPSPRQAKIDLGQPLFRRELFEKHLNGTLPFHEFGWDWRMIERFLQKGVRWKHIDDPTFIFRLAQHPHLITPEQFEIRALSAFPFRCNPEAIENGAERGLEPDKLTFASI
jgi:hypothetical protein